MADIALARLDDRLVHGQVVTKWVQATGCGRIIIIDDALSTNKFLADVFRMAAPRGVKVDVTSVAQAVQEWSTDQFGPGKIMLLFKFVATAKRAVEQGLSLSALQVAGLGAGPNKVVVYRTVSLTEQDARDLKALQESGVDVFFQSIPEEKSVKLSNVLDKHFKNI